MLVVSIAGSPGMCSRSGELLNYAAQQLQRRGTEVVSYRVRDFAVEDLLHARFDSPQARQFLEHVQQADGLIIATPVYKASFSGALKALLDLLPERALAEKVVLPIASGGSAAHMLAVDYALKPVLTALKAEVLEGVYAVDAQIQYDEADRPALLEPQLFERLDEALEHLLLALSRRPQPLAAACHHCGDGLPRR